MVDGVDVVLPHHIGYHLAIGDIAFLSGSRLQQLACGLRAFDVTGNHMFIAITASQLLGQFRAYLPGRANH